MEVFQIGGRCLLTSTAWFPRLKIEPSPFQALAFVSGACPSSKSYRWELINSEIPGKLSSKLQGTCLRHACLSDHRPREGMLIACNSTGQHKKAQWIQWCEVPLLQTVIFSPLSNLGYTKRWLHIGGSEISISSLHFVIAHYLQRQWGCHSSGKFKTFGHDLDLLSTRLITRVYSLKISPSLEQTRKKRPLHSSTLFENILVEKHSIWHSFPRPYN